MMINCDMGEGLCEIDRQLMPHIDMASIACGGHTGNERSMAQAIELAIMHQVSIGAHPSYPDKENFGRKRIVIGSQHLTDSISEQLNRLQTCTKQAGTKVDYIKAHGALYNDCLNHPEIMDILLSIALRAELMLVIQAHPKQIQHDSVVFEAFADRGYTSNGALLDRKSNNAVHDSVEKSLKQATDIYTKKGLFSTEGRWLPISADTLCVHSDSPNCVATTRAIRSMIG